MNGDLSLSQSLGGLRIANPDDASPSSSVIGRNIRKSSVSPLSSSTTNASHQERNDLQVPPTIPATGLRRSPSPLDFNPNAFSTNGHLVNARTPSPKASSYAQKQANRQSIPLTYQAQQQAQFPQYPTMMPLSQRMSSSGGGRPLSALYGPSRQPEPNGKGLGRQSSQRQRSDGTRSSMLGLPQRSSSRGAMTAMQAGVPNNEVLYNDRLYKSSQPVYGGNGPLPPRRSSKGMGTGHEDSMAPTLPAPSLPGHELDTSKAAGEPLPTTREEWQEKGAAMGSKQEIDSQGRPSTRSVKKGVKDFNFGRTLGEGSYSTVMAATDRTTNREYAIKVLDKRHIIKEKKIKYVNIEKDALNRLTDHPGVVRLYYTFQDMSALYYVLDLASGGELLGVLKRMSTFNEECARFYSAQILDTVDYMHARGVIHRDLKPENVLLDEQRHVKITDFGTAKLLESPSRNAGGPDLASTNTPMDNPESSRASSFVGTAEYVSPELLTDKSACKASDLWAFGCIVYQLLAGRPPFKAANEYLTFQKIVALEYSFPDNFPTVAKDLIERLLVLDPSRRLSLEHIKSHAFFRGITWGRGLWKQAAPQLKSFTPTTSDQTNDAEVSPNGDESGSCPPNITPAHSTAPTHYGSGPPINGGAKVNPRTVTELPPPSQLDIEWSPILASNERILKLGNFTVNITSAPSSPHNKSGQTNGEPEAPKKLSRFFGGSAQKKRQRLVLVTSGARVIIAAAGGDDKKAKHDVSLLQPGCTWRKWQDSKGFSHWCVEMRDKHYTFEDPKSTSSDGSATSAAAQDWLDTVDSAREMALSQNAKSYSGDDPYRAVTSGGIPSSRDLDLDSPARPDTSLRVTMQKNNSGTDSDSLLGRKRFSKRQSKSGLAAVF